MILWHSFFFMLFALVACVFAVAVVVTQNIVRMAFYLIVSLGATAGLFFLAGADFVGAMQLMIYVGGTLVLLVFGVMLTAQGPYITMKTRAGEWILAAIVGGSLLAVLLQTALSVDIWRHGAEYPVAEYAADDPEAQLVAQQADPRLHPSRTATPIGMGFIGARVDKIGPEDADRQGLSGYLLPFQAVGVHLMVVLIGAAYLARARRRVTSGS